MAEHRARERRTARGRVHGRRESPAKAFDQDWSPSGPQLLLAGLALAAAYAMVFTGLTTVIAAGSWSLRALSITTSTIMIAAVTRSLRPGTRVTPALLGSLVGAGIWIYWLLESGRFSSWILDPVGMLQDIHLHVLEGSAPLTAAGAFADLLLFVVLLASLVTSLVLVGLGRPLGAGLLVFAILLLPAFVTGVGVDWITMLGAGALLALLAWLESPTPSMPGFIAAGATVAVAAGLVTLAPEGRDRVWNDALLPGPVSESVPDVTIALADDLRERSETRAFTFTATTPGSYRFTLATLSEFTGGRWLPQDALAEDGANVGEPRDPASVPPERSTTGAAEASIGARASVTVTVEGLLSRWLPLPQSTIGVGPGEESSGFDAEQWVWTADAATARADRTLTRRGDQFTAEAAQLLAGSDALSPLRSMPEASGRLFDEAEAAPEQLAPYLDLPDDLPDEISTAAESVAGGADDRYAVGMALQRWFRSNGFVYDESAPYQPGMDPDDPYAVMTALLQQRSGFCVHYASTFAVMARELGAPTRIAVGYASRTDDDESVVRGGQLHAWPEIHIEEVGWVAFEPTPGGAGVAADTGRRVPAVPEERGDEAGTSEPTTPLPAPSPDVSPNDSERTEAPDPDRESGSQTADAPRPPDLLLWAGGGLLLLLLLLPAGARRLRTRARLRRIAAGDRPAQQAWEEFTDTAIDLGAFRAKDDETAGSPRARTAEALLEHLEAEGRITGSAAGAARRLAEAMAAERYGASGPASDTEIAEELRLGVRGLREDRPRGTILRAALLPRSVFGAAR